MKLNRIMIVLLGLVCSTSWAAESSSSSSARTCFFANVSPSWRVLDRKHLVMWAPTQKDAYVIELFSSLSNLPFAETLALIDGNHDGLICGNSGDEIAVPGPNGDPFPSTIVSMYRADDAELQRLSEQYKVKLLPKSKPHQKQIHSDSNSTSSAAKWTRRSEQAMVHVAAAAHSNAVHATIITYRSAAPSTQESHVSTPLKQQLNSLHQQLSVLQAVDADTRASLMVLLVDISKLLDPNATAAAEPTPTEALETIAARFDADHPALSGALRQLLDALAKAGI